MALSVVVLRELKKTKPVVPRERKVRGSSIEVMVDPYLEAFNGDPVDKRIKTVRD
jgi:hypothetical protein